MISLRKLFQQGATGRRNPHKGRPGKVGGSQPGEGFTPTEDKKKSRFDTPRKTGNALSKVIGKKIGASSGQQGVFSTTAPLKKMADTERALGQMGFEKYEDNLMQSFVASYKSGNVRVHMYPSGKSFTGEESFHISISEYRDRLPFIPQD